VAGRPYRSGLAPEEAAEQPARIGRARALDALPELVPFQRVLLVGGPLLPPVVLLGRGFGLSAAGSLPRSGNVREPRIAPISRLAQFPRKYRTPRRDVKAGPRLRLGLLKGGGDPMGLRLAGSAGRGILPAPAADCTEDRAAGPSGEPEAAQGPDGSRVDTALRL